MAKMLGQEITTQAEFDEFHKNEFSPVAQAALTAKNDIEGVRIHSMMVEGTATNALYAAAIAVIVSLASLGWMFFH